MYACMYVYAGCGLGFRDTTCRYNYMIICSLFWDQIKAVYKNNHKYVIHIYIYMYTSVYL